MKIKMLETELGFIEGKIYCAKQFKDFTFEDIKNSTADETLWESDDTFAFSENGESIRFMLDNQFEIVEE